MTLLDLVVCTYLEFIRCPAYDVPRVGLKPISTGLKSDSGSDSNRPTHSYQHLFGFPSGGFVEQVGMCQNRGTHPERSFGFPTQGGKAVASFLFRCPAATKPKTWHHIFVAARPNQKPSDAIRSWCLQVLADHEELRAVQPPPDAVVHGRGPEASKVEDAAV